MLSYLTCFFNWQSLIFRSIHFTCHHSLSRLQTFFSPQTLAQHSIKNKYPVAQNVIIYNFRLFPFKILSYTCSSFIQYLCSVFHHSLTAHNLESESHICSFCQNGRNDKVNLFSFTCVQNYSYE